jgi:4-amino-4-deoxy-L-arabinose transferase-like glycosyltransferase
MSLEGVEILYHDGNPGMVLSLSRAGILPFFALASLVVFGWGRRYFGPAVAVIATGLFTLTPPVLAHAGLATTDMGLAARLGAAFLALLVWSEEPTLRNSLVFGVATAAAALAKFTALGYFPAAAAFALAAYLATVRPGLARLLELAKYRAPGFAIAVATGAALIWAAYLFSFGPVPEWGMKLPAPELFEGIRWAMRHNAHEGGGYLFGHLSATGWWYFFPTVIAIKSPIGFLALLACGLYVCGRKRSNLKYLLPLALCAGVLAPAMTSTVNYGIRHILPVYMGFSIMAAVGAKWLAQEAAILKPWGFAAAAALAGWMAVSGAAHHPQYLAYFNEFFSGPPENILVDSDLDWGQDTIRLARRLRELGATRVAFTTMNLDGRHLEQWPGLPPSQRIHPLIPVEGWTVVSPTFWKTSEYGLDHRYPNIKPWFEQLQPVERVGSLLLYYLPPGSLRRKG